MTGTLILCATPIGNLEDAPPRLGRTLGEVDVVYAEDTRRTAVLLAALGVRADVRSYFVGNEAERAGELEAHLLAGSDVALLTDAGVPAVSDPGVSAVRVARSVGATVTVLPGPSAVTAALAVSGLPAERFVFEGFLPRRGADREERLGFLRGESRTVVLFTSPHRALADLEALAGACGSGREVCVAREMTKRHEEVWWGTLGEAVDRWTETVPRGEFTLVLAGGVAPLPDAAEATAVARRLIEAGASARDAVREVAGLTGVSRRELYERVHAPGGS